jgi:hypothetical protein
MTYKNEKRVKDMKMTEENEYKEQDKKSRRKRKGR